MKHARFFDQIGSEEIEVFSGKNASLGETTRTLTERGVSVPNGFVTTAEAYRPFLRDNELAEAIRSHIEKDHKSGSSLEKARESICQAPDRYPQVLFPSRKIGKKTV